MFIRSIIFTFLAARGISAAPPDVACYGLEQRIPVVSGIPPQSAAVRLPAVDVSISSWVYFTALNTTIHRSSFVPSELISLSGNDDRGYIFGGLAEAPGWWIPPYPDVFDFFVSATDVLQNSDPLLVVSIPAEAWTLLTISFRSDVATVYVNESGVLTIPWASVGVAPFSSFTDVHFDKAYATESRSTQEYADIQLYRRALGLSDVSARVSGDPSLCTPAPPPRPPPPPFAPSPPSPPFAPAQEYGPCISSFVPLDAYSEACYVILPQPVLVCNGTRITVGCGEDAEVRIRFPARGDVRAIPKSACTLSIDTSESTSLANMVIEVACTRPPCESRPISVQSFSSSGECETVPVSDTGYSIEWPVLTHSEARILLPSRLPLSSLGGSESIAAFQMNSLLYLPLPEVLCPGSILYVLLPIAYDQFMTWEVGCGAYGVCAPMFDYPAQNASIPYNIARINGRFEARSSVHGDLMRLRLAYTGSSPMVSPPNTAIQFSLRDDAPREPDVYYEISKYMNALDSSPSDYVGIWEQVRLNNLYNSLTDPNYIGAFIEGPSECARLANQTFWCVPQPGVTACASVCAGSHVEVSADRLAPDTVLVVFGVVRLTAESPSWSGVAVGDTTSDVECYGTCGVAAVSFSWQNPAGGCESARRGDAASDRFVCAWNAMAIHGKTSPLCNVTVEAGQVVELWVDYVSFHDVTISLGQDTFLLTTDKGFEDADEEINPGCPTFQYNSFIDAKPLGSKGSAWRGSSRPLGAGTYELSMQSLERRHNVTSMYVCRATDVVATVRALVRYPDPPVESVSRCTSTSPCVVSDTTLASVSTYAVSIQVAGAHRCGGYMAGPRTVVTAAHCAIAVVDAATVVYGTTNLSYSGLSVSAAVAGSIVHELYDTEATRSNDVSVLTLASSFSGIDPARVSDSQPTESLAAEFGWGNGSPLMRIALVNVVPREECIREFGVFSEDGVCMQRAGPVTVCQGDSGSPSAWIDAFGDTGKIKVRGILGLPSWGASCLRESAFSVFVNLSHHADWLERATLASETCGGNSTCASLFTNGTVYESTGLQSPPSLDRTPPGAAAPPSPSLRTMFDVANSAASLGAAAWTFLVCVALLM